MHQCLTDAELDDITEMIMENYVDKLVGILNNIEFKGLEKLKCGDAMCTYIDSANWNHQVTRVTWRPFARVIRASLSTKLKWEKRQDGAIAFVFSNCHASRRDHFSWFKKITDLSENCIIFTNGKRRFTFHNLHHINKFVIWYHMCRKNQISVKCSIAICSKLYIDFIEYMEIMKFIEDCNCSLVFAVSATNLTDNLIIQKSNLEGRTTASTHDGVFCATEKSKRSLSITNSVYFLTYGQFTKEQCILAGMKEQRIIMMGMPHQIGKKFPSKMEIKKNKIIGIIFSGNDEDIVLLKIVREFARHAHYKIMIKFHPGIDASCYCFRDGELDEDMYCDEITVYEFAEKVDFSVVEGSTVFLEYISNLIPVFLYDGEYKIFESVTWCKFKNAEELEALAQYYLENHSEFQKRMTETIEYYCGISGTKIRYKKFLNHFEQKWCNSL